MIGYGFMGRCHSNAFRTAPNFFDLPRRPVLKAACGRDAAKTQAFADRWGYETSRPTGASSIARPDIDLVDICVPNDLHAEIAIAAAEAGKAVITEKPLARTTAEGETMVAAVEKAGVPISSATTTAACPPSPWSSRWSTPASSAASTTTAPSSCRTGPSPPTSPRAAPAPGASTSRPRAPASPATSSPTASTPRSGSTARIASLTAMTETFVKERTHAVTGKVQPVGIDDAAAVLTRFENGSLGTFESTRYARGHKALYTLEINGEHGSLAWDLHDMNRLAWFDHRTEGALPRLVLDPRHRRRAPLPRQVVGPRPHHRLRALLRAHHGRLHRRHGQPGTPAGPTFRDALETNRICDAIIASGKSGAWQTL